MQRLSAKMLITMSCQDCTLARMLTVHAHCKTCHVVLVLTDRSPTELVTESRCFSLLVV